MPYQPTPFDPPPWLRNGHAQTLWAALARRLERQTLREEVFPLPDGDRIYLAWATNDVLGNDAPLAVLVHGLGGCRDSNYIHGSMRALTGIGVASVAMECRGAGGRPNQKTRFYHAAETDDIHAVCTALRQRHHGRPIVLIGFSLGGSMTLNYVSRHPSPAIDAAIGVSVPFELARCADVVNQGLAKIYQWDMLRNLKKLYRAKFRDHPQPPVPIADVAAIKTLRGFDDLVTAPFHGFDGVDDYYRRASCRTHLGKISLPTLILHSRDDPFIAEDSIPAAHEVSDQVYRVVTEYGGHVGFRPRRPPDGRYWMEQEICRFVESLSD